MLKRIFGSEREEGTFTTIRDKETKSRRFVVLCLLLATAFVGWLYLFFGSGVFRVKSVQAEGLVHLEGGEVQKAALEALDEQGRWPWQWRNILLIDESRLESDLERRLFAEKVTVEKSYPDILRLKVEERQSSLVVIANNELYLVDHMGVGVRRIADEEQAQVLARLENPSPTQKTDLPILTVHGTPNFIAGEPFVDTETAQTWLDAFYDLGEAGFGYRNAVLESVSSTKLVLNLFEPYDVYFDLLAPIQPQVTSFYAFLKVKPPATKINEYVDARIPGKIYYK
jgi:hypothetical protein